MDWTTRCAEVTQALPVDSATRNNLMVELWIMSGLAHERRDLSTLISEDIMKESSVYQMIIERGKQQGAKETTIESILDFLNRRFNVSIAQTLMPSLEAIDDLQHLRQLLHEAAEAERLENFMQVLETYRNGS